MDFIFLKDKVYSASELPAGDSLDMPGSKSAQVNNCKLTPQKKSDEAIHSLVSFSI